MTRATAAIPAIPLLAANRYGPYRVLTFELPAAPLAVLADKLAILPGPNQPIRLGYRTVSRVNAWPRRGPSRVEYVMMDLGTAELDREADMGTWGTGPFDNDGAFDPLDLLVTQPAGQRRQALERIFLRSCRCSINP